VSSTPGTEATVPSQAQPAAQPHVPAQSLGTDQDNTSAPQQSGSHRMPYAFERGLTLAPGAGLPALTSERITFTARCPACGNDAEWLEVREDTRVRNSVRCDCAPDIVL
jgi:hypothetical protein